MTTTDHNWVPVDACTLPTIEQPLRLAEFNSLFSHALTAADRIGPTRARLSLVGEPGLVKRVQDLSDRESACCSFFTFTLTPFEGSPDASAGVHLDILVPDHRTDVLAALVDVAESARDSRGS